MKQKETFFSKDKQFYHSFFFMLGIVALQNIVAYSVNMADNIMLGSYQQDVLSGAATVNQLFFLFQQFIVSAGEGLVILASQYWGQNNIETVRKISWIAIRLSIFSGIVCVLICGFFPYQLMQLFTNDPAIIEQGAEYLSILKYSFLLFGITTMIEAALRSVEVVKIAFYISIVSLIINVIINYTLIFGHFGAPELGIRGAAIGTLIARAAELAIILIYAWKVENRLQLFKGGIQKTDQILKKDFTKVVIPTIAASMLWAVSVPMQTAILGHLSSDAIAANSVATTFYQYMKVIVVAMSSCSSVLMAKTVSQGNMVIIREVCRTLTVICVIVGVVLALIIYTVRGPLLSLYNLNNNTLSLANQILILMCIIMVTMSYQMPVSAGIMRGGGDPNFMMKMNLISVWCIVIPLSLLSAFVWKLSIVWVVLCIQSDQIFKCVPCFIRIRSYKWVRNLTRREDAGA